MLHALSLLTILYIHYRPVNKEELFNLRHSSARNVIERIFGVLKRRYRILLVAPAYSLDIQARIPAALCAIHNFIRIHDPADEAIGTSDDDDDDDGDTGAPFDRDHIAAAAAAAELDGPSQRRDRIAQQMWENYLVVRLERGLVEEDESEESSGHEDDESSGED
jgi:DDE superfamily endonuclease